jgi:hypothetical protein
MKTVYLILVAMVLLSLIFGCTQNPINNQTDVNVPKVTTQEQVDLTTSDVSTDISGINSSLNEIDSLLSE